MPEEQKIKQIKKIPTQLLDSIELFSKISDLKREREENDAAISTAVWYEKIRAAMEYQESHLMFKNAVLRIIQRSLLLSPKTKAEKIFNTMVNELIWANYITPKTLDDKKSARVLVILDKYTQIIRRSNSINRTHTEIVRFFASICACDIEEEIFGKEAELSYLDFIFSAIGNNFQFNSKHISSEDHQIQIKLSIYVNIVKPDLGYLSYYALKLTYPEWRSLKSEEYLKLTRSIDPFIGSFERHLLNPLRNRYLLGVRNMAAPFIVIRTYLLSNRTTREWAENNPSLLESNFSHAYESLRIQSNIKIWRGIWRALIFLLLSKTILAFLIEIPVDRFIHGEILWFPLIANISFPPFLMLISGASIPKIPIKNTELIKDALSEIVEKGKLTIEKPYFIERKKRTKSSNLFNYIFSVYSLAILVGVVWLLIQLRFSAISILLFFIFISAVSFLAFRIRVNSKELLVKRKSQDSITTLVEFIFLPFISLGKIMSDGLNRLNPLLLAVDFIIEAPFKTIIKILRTWFNFISAKKEEMEY